MRFINLAEDTASGDLDKVLARIVAEVEARGRAWCSSTPSARWCSPAEGGNSFVSLQHSSRTWAC
jgi:circadian clock protein KaiC